MSRHRTWVEINEQALRANIRALGSLLSEETRFCAVVKSNAYGHGVEQVVSICDKLKSVIPNNIAYAVDNIDEALVVRELAPTAMILVLGYTLHDRLSDAVEKDIELTVYDIETVQALDAAASKLNKRARVHLKIETGTNRQGILPADLPRFLESLKGSTSVSLSGVSTHFANIEDTPDQTYAMNQFEEYQQAVKQIRSTGFNPEYLHTACSAAILLYPNTHANLVRAGISLYGLWSSESTKQSVQAKNKATELEPVLSWKTHIAQIKELPIGTAVGYGLTERLKRDSRIGIIPVGYWDGFDRGLSSKGEVLVGGTLCKVIGRVCMNMCMVDLTDVPEAKPEDEVVLIGKQGSGIIEAEDLANKIDTIHYEVVTRINPKLPRIIT